MRILLVNPFHTASHKRWADAIVKHSKHDVDLVSLPGRHWKWRMHGAAVQLSRKLPKTNTYDVLIVTDMIDLATLRGLRPDLAKVKTIVYFHENQITYPWSPDDEDLKKQRDQRYGWINYTSAMAADELWFNSAYHQRVWNEQLPSFLYKFPEGKQLPLPHAKQRVLPIPIEGLKRLIRQPRNFAKDIPTIVWNHRWEYDKRPELFFEILRKLKTEGLRFKLIVLGESYARVPEVFAKAKETFANEILHWGYVEHREDYLQWLLKADILLITSQHDFFGISVVEALAAGATPVLPNGLAYDEHIAPDRWISVQYKTEKEAVEKVKSLLNNKIYAQDESTRTYLEKYDALKVIHMFDKYVSGE